MLYSYNEDIGVNVLRELVPGGMDTPVHLYSLRIDMRVNGCMSVDRLERMKNHDKMSKRTYNCSSLTLMPLPMTECKYVRSASPLFFFPIFAATAWGGNAW